MRVTENIGLKLPERNEQFNIDDWNDNTRKIDASFKAQEGLVDDIYSKNGVLPRRASAAVGGLRVTAREAGLAGNAAYISITAGEEGKRYKVILGVPSGDTVSEFPYNVDDMKELLAAEGLQSHGYEFADNWVLKKVKVVDEYEADGVTPKMWHTETEFAGLERTDGRVYLSGGTDGSFYSSLMDILMPRGYTFAWSARYRYKHPGIYAIQQKDITGVLAGTDTRIRNYTPDVDYYADAELKTPVDTGGFTVNVTDCSGYYVLDPGTDFGRFVTADMLDTVPENPEERAGLRFFRLTRHLEADKYLKKEISEPCYEIAGDDLTTAEKVHDHFRFGTWRRIAEGRTLIGAGEPSSLEGLVDMLKPVYEFANADIRGLLYDPERTYYYIPNNGVHTPIPRRWFEDNGYVPGVTNMNTARYSDKYDKNRQFYVITRPDAPANEFTHGAGEVLAENDSTRYYRKTTATVGTTTVNKYLDVTDTLRVGFADGQTGGEYNHTLTVNELAGHSRHTVHTGWYGSEVGGDYQGTIWDAAMGNVDVGRSFAHNNIQPYAAVYYWQRIA